MKSENYEKDTLIKEVKERIESNFKDCVVIWRGTGVPDEDYDVTEIFEALWIHPHDYDRFEDFVWDLEENLAQPNGYSIMVHSVSPKVTKEYRWTEYQEGLARRNLAKAEAG